MLKYADTKIVFSEIPDEITLAINISNCPCHCSECHSSYLAEDIGEPLTLRNLEDLISTNSGISCVSFMGGDSEPSEINKLAKVIRITHPRIKTAWYSGRQELSEYIELENFDYIKLGPYISEKGPLTSNITNQVMYKVDTICGESTITDITSRFWK